MAKWFRGAFLLGTAVLQLALIAGNERGGEMLHLKVRYFLSDEGKSYFADWFDKVYKITSMQDGFRGMRYENNEGTLVVYLDFETQDKLDKWIDQPEHDELASEIEQYFTNPQEVETEH